jgi:hypothetical protein
LIRLLKISLAEANLRFAIVAQVVWCAGSDDDRKQAVQSSSFW